MYSDGSSTPADKESLSGLSYFTAVVASVNHGAVVPKYICPLYLICEELTRDCTNGRYTL